MFVFVRPALLAVILTGACAAFAAAASAQPSNWEMPTSGASISLSADRPFLNQRSFFGEFDFDLRTSAWVVSTTQPVGPVRLVAELPFAFQSFDAPEFNGETVGDGGDGAALGNAQVGAELDLLAAPLTLGGYLRIPTTASSDLAAEVIGALGDYERVGLYGDLMTITAMIEGRPQVRAAPGLSFRLRAMPELLVATEDNALADGAELLVGYAAQAFVSTGSARIGGGLSGVSIVTEDADERHEVSAGVIADAGLGPIRLGAAVRLPFLGDASNAVDAVLGLRLTYGMD